MGFFAKQRTKGIPKNKEFSPLREISLFSISLLVEERKQCQEESNHHPGFLLLNRHRKA